MVYVSVAYAPYYAITATSQIEAGRMALIEVDTEKLDHEQLMPDEDFIAQSMSGAVKMITQFRLQDASLKKRQFYVRKHLDRWKHLWRQSLQFLGNACYKGAIPPGAITRAVAYSAAENPATAFLSAEPTITLQNYRFCGSQYRALSKFIMGDKIQPEELLTEFPETMKRGPQYKEMVERCKAMIETRKIETIFYDEHALRLAREAEVSNKLLCER